MTTKPPIDWSTIPKQKVCTNCKFLKDISEFNLKYYSERKNNHYSPRSVCKTCECEYSSKYRKENAEKVLNSNRAYLAKNRDKQKAWNRKHFQNNGERVRERARINGTRYRKDANKRLRHNLTQRISELVKNISKSARTMKLVGCTIDYLKKWIEYQFYDGMNWDNYGSHWHIDHVTPCAFFNLVIKENQFACFNWQNLRPLKASKNQSKNDKIIPFEIMLQQLKVKCYLLQQETNISL